MSDWDTYWERADRIAAMPCPPGHCGIAAKRPEPLWRRVINKILKG